MAGIKFIAGLLCVVLGVMLLGAGITFDRYTRRAEMFFVPGALLFFLGLALLAR